MERCGWCSRENRVKNALHGVERCAAPAFEAHEGRFARTRFSREGKGVNKMWLWSPEACGLVHF